MSNAVKAQRNDLVRQTMAHIRTIEKDQGVTREALEDIKAVMLDLAAHKELFPEEDFPPEANDKGFVPVHGIEKIL